MAGSAKRRALLFVSGYCASCLRTNLLDGLDKWALPLTVNRLWHVYNQVIWVLVFCFSPFRHLTLLHFRKGNDEASSVFYCFVYLSYVEWTSQSWWYWMLEFIHPFHSSSIFFWRCCTGATGVSVSLSQQTYIVIALYSMQASPSTWPQQSVRKNTLSAGSSVT